MTDPVRKAAEAVAYWGTRGHEAVDLRTRLAELRAALAAETPDAPCKSCGQPRDHYSHADRYSMPDADNNHLGSHLYQPAAADTPTPEYEKEPGIPADLENREDPVTGMQARPPEPTGAADVAKTVCMSVAAHNNVFPCNCDVIAAALVSYADAHAKDAVAAERERGHAAGILDERGRWEAGCPEPAPEPDAQVMTTGFYVDPRTGKRTPEPAPTTDESEEPSR